MPTMTFKTPKRIAKTILNALNGGVVPRIGLPYITVGRKAEIEALLADVDIIEEGGASFRFIAGKYGSGKSFLLQTIRNYAMDKGFVVADVDLSPERRLQGTKGQGLATYKELMQNLATKTMPEGGALSLILDRWVESIRAEAASGIEPSDPPAFKGRLEAEVFEAASPLAEVVHGHDFAKALAIYAEALAKAGAEFDASEEARREAEDARGQVLKWFRGEFATRAEAKAALGVDAIVSDDTWYDFIKVFALFLRRAGYKGLLVLIDELVNLCKIPNSISRQYNYEKILTMYNDALQGKARYLGIIMSGTPQSIEDRRRGVFSYEALRSRLESGRFSSAEFSDFLSPVIRLKPLTAEELLVLIEKLAVMHAELYGAEKPLSVENLAQFLKIEYGRVGAESLITPREIIRDFIETLNLLCQHKDLTFEALMNSVGHAAEPSGADRKTEDERLFAEFTL